MKTVTYQASQLLSCAPCSGNVILCIDASLVVLNEPFIEAQIIDVLSAWNNCGEQVYTYSISYDELLLSDPSTDLVSSDINGLFCKGCLTDFIETKGVPSMAYILSLLQPYFDLIQLVTDETEFIAAIGDGVTAHIVIGDSFNLTATRTVPSIKTTTILNGSQITTGGHNLDFEGPFATGAYPVFVTSPGEVRFKAGSVDTIRAEWFGAVADSTTDSTNAIQSALESGFDGGEVSLLAGNYLISATLSLGGVEGISVNGAGIGNYTGAGNGNGTVILWDSGVAPAAGGMCRCSADGFRISDLAFDGAATSTIGLTVVASKSYTIENVLISDVNGVGLLIGDSAVNSIVTGGSIRSFISSRNVTGVKVDGLQTESNSLYGGRISENTGYGVEHIYGELLFSGIEFNTNILGDIYINPTPGSSFSGLTIDKCRSISSAIFLTTADFAEGVAEKPIVISGSRLLSKDGSDRNIYHRTTMPLMMFGNEGNGKWESTGKSGGGYGPPVIIDIGNTWTVASTKPDACTILEASKDDLRNYNEKDIVQNLGGSTPVGVDLKHSNTTFTNYYAAGDVTFALPAASIDVNTLGTKFRFIRYAAFAVNILPDGTDTFYGQAPGKYIQLTSDGAVVDIVMLAGGQWHVVNSVGTFVYLP